MPFQGECSRGHCKNLFHDKKILKFQDIEPRKHAEKVSLKLSKNTVVTWNQWYKWLFVSYLQQCHSTSMSFSFQGPQLGLRLTWAGASTPWSWYKCNIPKCNSTCWPLHCMPCIQLVTYRCTDAPFTGVLKNFRTSAKKFRTRSKFPDISGQLLKCQEFQDNAQAGPAS